MELSLSLIAWTFASASAGAGVATVFLHFTLIKPLLRNQRNIAECNQYLLEHHINPSTRPGNALPDPLKKN